MHPPYWTMKSFTESIAMEQKIRGIPLDEVDIRILDSLQQDASLSNQDLAAAALTSPATCLRRVKRMVDIGAGLTVIAEVTLDRQGAEHLAAFEERAVADAAVQQCHRVSPGPDFVLILQVADMSAWNALVDRLFTQDANVRNVKSFFSVRRAKFETKLPLPSHRDKRQ